MEDALGLSGDRERIKEGVKMGTVVGWGTTTLPCQSHLHPWALAQLLIGVTALQAGAVGAS